MQIHILTCGWMMVILGIFHAFFHKRFEWKNDMANVSLINRQMMYVHTFFVAFTVFLFGILSVLYTRELVNDHFGKVISLGIGFFWFIRWVFQFFVFSKKLWRGKKFETIIHCIFSIIWTYLSSVYLYNWYI